MQRLDCVAGEGCLRRSIYVSILLHHPGLFVRHHRNSEEAAPEDCRSGTASMLLRSSPFPAVPPGDVNRLFPSRIPKVEMLLATILAA
jgi:hypothetical protein